MTKDLTTTDRVNMVPLLDEQQTAKYLHCTVEGLRRMRREKRGPRWTRVGRLVRYRREWVDEYLEANAEPPA